MQSFVSHVLATICMSYDQVVHAVIVQGNHAGAQAVLQHAAGQGTSNSSNSNSNNNNNSTNSHSIMTARALRATGVNAARWAVRRDPHEDDDDTDHDDVMFHRDDNHDDNDNEGDYDDSILEETSSVNAVVDLEAGRSTRVRRAATHRMPLGFYRLRVTARLSRAKISVLRMYFGGHMDRWLAVHPAVNQVLQQQEPVDTLRRRRLLEEAWMEAQGPASEFRLNLNLHTPTTQQVRWAAANASSPQEAAALYRTSVTGSSVVVGTDRYFCWGFLLQFFVGFFMLLWVWMPTVPHMQKMGILAGYSFHLALGMFNKHDEAYGDDVVLLGD
jgi:hypothetical protein